MSNKLYNLDLDKYKKSYNNGVLTLMLKSWGEFLDVTNNIASKKCQLFWRGQRDDRLLKSSFDRNHKIKTLSSFIGRQKTIDILLKKFKVSLNGILPKMSNIKDDEIWAIGQHYGLPTPLLDWTADPYIAAYFALHKKSEFNKYCIIYALNKKAQQLIGKKKHPKTKVELGKVRFIEFLDLTTTTDESQNKRLEMQKGRFTKALNGIDIETNVLNYARKKTKIIKNEEIIFIKIFIPTVLRDEVLKFLETEKKITHGKLFPDYAGAVDICKIDLGIDDCCIDTPKNN